MKHRLLISMLLIGRSVASFIPQNIEVAGKNEALSKLVANLAGKRILICL